MKTLEINTHSEVAGSFCCCGGACAERELKESHCKRGERPVFLLPPVQKCKTGSFSKQFCKLRNRSLLQHDNPCFIYKFSSFFLVWRLLQCKWQPLKAQVQPKLSTPRIDPPQTEMERPLLPLWVGECSLKTGGHRVPACIRDYLISGPQYVRLNHFVVPPHPPSGALKGCSRFNLILFWQPTESEHECLAKHTVHKQHSNDQIKERKRAI